MSASKPVAFIIGYGPNVGAAIARKFKSEGFNVAISGRKVDENAAKEDGYLGISADCADIASVRNAFDRLEGELGPAAAVIYNAFSANNTTDEDPLANPYETFLNNVIVTGVNFYEVARRAKAGFEKLSADTPRALIGTGNLQPWVTFPFALGMSVGKRAMANIVEASAAAYGSRGHRFYYAHEVKGETGGPQVPPTGQAHAEVFYRIWKQKEQGPWEVCFTETGALYDRAAGKVVS
ncbi:hypothetical protein M407DRAFT_27319 [Tulasnella calospora MUT 4182]|uniref:Uncharacterized protein n=1 Tax=Tulasnella calospora MUT 4182 TaxID=1051891 RepID=A0A0C3Q3B7_9AGAM|nr:hypothetical protein M407DRAFT_27319 [Tulasnella calospora MUT 4182]